MDFTESFAMILNGDIPMKIKACVGFYMEEKLCLTPNQTLQMTLRSKLKIHPTLYDKIKKSIYFTRFNALKNLNHSPSN